MFLERYGFILLKRHVLPLTSPHSDYTESFSLFPAMPKKIQDVLAE